MQNIRVSLTVLGGLLALAGGAATASWGLTPLTGSLTAPAPQIVASDAGPADPATTIGPAADTSQSSDGSPSPGATQAAYAVPNAPPADVDADAPRPDSEPTAEIASGDPAPGMNPSLSADSLNASADFVSAEQSPPHEDTRSGATAISNGVAVGVGPD